MDGMKEKEEKKSKREIKAAATDRQTAVNRRFIPLCTAVDAFLLFLRDVTQLMVRLRCAERGRDG